MTQLNDSGIRVAGVAPMAREFHMSYENFLQIKKIAYRITGISLSDHKQNMIYGRLARRLRALGLQDFDQYCEILANEDPDELHEFVNSITTNLTSFFRESHHFEYLYDVLIPHLIKSNGSTRKIRIWSAGCSTGEEPHSIAMVLRAFPAIQSWDIKVLATDLDSNVVEKGKSGIYSSDRVGAVPERYKKYITINKTTEEIRIRDDVRNLITFKQLNLLHEWPMKGPFDFIFCRNVVIYFDAETQKKLFDRYANILKSDGHLFIGHSENLHKICDRFDGLGRTIYRKIR